jgi:phosphoglycerate dehydrogenase-like enzyme
MKEGSYLIHVARGGIVDQDAVISALRSGYVAGSCVDALSPENPLWAMHNVLITPHSHSTTPARSSLCFSIISEINRDIRYSQILSILEGIKPWIIKSQTLQKKGSVSFQVRQNSLAMIICQIDDRPET